MKVLIDTNVLIDLFSEREPFVDDAKVIFQAQIGGTIEAYVTATTVTDINYILYRLTRNRSAVIESVTQTIDVFKIVPVNARLLSFALGVGGNDFEDDLQITSALSVGADAIVTRDIDDFKHSPIRVLTPSEMVLELEAMNKREQDNE